MALFGVRLLPVGEDYLSSLGQMTILIGEAAQSLVEMFADGSGERERFASDIRKIKRSCDEINRGISKGLEQVFITAIDREDIYALATALSDLIKLMEALASASLTYEIEEYDPHMHHFAGLIQRMALEINALVPTVDRPGDISDRVREIRRLEREGREIYREAVGELFSGSSDLQSVIVCKDLYKNLEATVGRCHNIGALVEFIAIKNA